VDADSQSFALLSKIIDHKYDATAVQPSDMYVAATGNCNRHMRRTTKGWQLCISWRDGTTTHATIKQYCCRNNPSNIKWGMSSEKYVLNAIANVEIELQQIDKALSTKASTPVLAGYRPELDVSPLLDDDRANYYQNLIGVLCWAVELGRLDIHVGVALLSSYLVQPRVGHLEQVFHIFAYLKSHAHLLMVFDDRPLILSESRFKICDWSEFYPGAAEPIPPNAIPPRGNAVQINAFVDADHAGDRVTRRSHTGIILYVNKAPIIWFSKRQNTVETSNLVQNLLQCAYVLR
jgi:hypothetical protein